VWKGGLLETHVVRIYRYERNNPRKLVGIVETIGEESEVKKAFTNLDELWAIINPSKGKPIGDEKGEIGKQRRGD
jgi:hypothetical protein